MIIKIIESGHSIPKPQRMDLHHSAMQRTSSPVWGRCHIPERAGTMLAAWDPVGRLARTLVDIISLSDAIASQSPSDFFKVLK